MAVPVVPSSGSSFTWSWGWRQSAAGCAGSLAVIAVPLSLGLLVFAGAGSAAVGLGIAAAFATTVVGGLLYAWLGRSTLPAAGPTSATSLILAGLVLELCADRTLLDGTPAGLGRLLGLCGIAVALSGLMQLALARLGLARLARMVPRPVLGGFMNGVALLILIGQVPLLLGLPSPGWPGSDLWAGAQPWAAAIGSGTVALVLGLQRMRSRLPPLVAALVVFTAAHAAASALWPGTSFGPTLDRIGYAGVEWVGGWPWLAPGLVGALVAHAESIMTAAAVLALIGALESMLGLLALDEALSGRHDPGRELAVLGLVNLAVGLLCGLPAVVLRARAIAILHSGGTGRWAAASGALAMALLVVPGLPLLGWVPLPVLGGIMVTIGFGLVDRWAGQLLVPWWRGEGFAELRAGLAVMVAVCGVTLWQGFAAGVLLGVLLSMVIFIARMNRSLLRASLHAGQRPSRRIWPSRLEALLRERRPGIVLWELEGAVFFGNADRLLSMADALAADTRVLVIDLSRVRSIDETGAMALLKLGHRLRQRRQDVLLAGTEDEAGSPSGGGRSGARLGALRAYGVRLPSWPDLDRATEEAELRVLGPLAEQTLVSVSLGASELLRGLSADQCARVEARLTRRTLKAGERLFAQGDPADGLYLVNRGSVSVIARDGRRTRRYLSISPGMILGETAMLDGGGRSADAVADSPVVLHHLSSAALERLGEEAPAIASHLYRNIAVHLSARLRASSAAWVADGH